MMRKPTPDNGTWYPACGGTEEVFTSRSGVRLLYCYQPSSGCHRYLNVDTDMILEDDEAHMLMWGRAA